MAPSDKEPSPADSGPVLGVDLGTKRIGLAVSDPGRTVASGLETLKVKGLSEAVGLVAGRAAERGVCRVVVGLPLNMNGSEGEKAKQARQFARLLKNRLGASVVLWDERLTSVQARSELGRLGVKGLSSKDKARVDRVAATILLQSYLDSLR